MFGWLLWLFFVFTKAVADLEYLQIEFSVNFETGAMAKRNEQQPVLYTNLITL